jgi:hypothetical protein
MGGLMTEYVVLEQKDTTFERLGNAEATSDVQAIKAATSEREDRSGSFVAIPVRSFRVRQRSVETKQVDRWA